jgi:3-hydroxyisobutyrate dehydrogenase
VSISDAASVRTVVGVVGLGAIGAGVARSLANHDYEVVGYDVRPEAVAALAGVARPTATPCELAEASEVVFLAVYDDAQVRDVLSRDDGVLAAAAGVRAVVILSTVTLDTIRWAEHEARARGVSVLDCGVTGGHALTEQGSIVAMVGGSPDAVAAVRPVIEAFGSPTVHTGALGTGMQAKLARNMIVYGRWYVAWEALRLAEAGGVAPEHLIEICDAADRLQDPLSELRRGALPGAPPSAEIRERRQRLSGFVHKDLRAAIERGEELGIALPAAALVEQTHEELLGLVAEQATVQA